MDDATVNINGEITDGASAVVSVFDHGFLFGEGVYETLRTYNSRPFLLDRHLRRLRASSEAIGMRVPIDDRQFGQRIDDTMASAAITNACYIRLLVTRGVGDLSYDPAGCPHPTIVIIVRPHAENPDTAVTRGIGIIVSSFLRNHPGSVNPRIKSNNLLNNALAMQEALRAGAEEALMLNHRGEIAECSQSNVFLVRDGVAMTPSLDAGLLEGVTRNFLFELGASIDVPVRDAVLTVDDLATADELFITSTTREVLPVTRVDNRVIGGGTPGPITITLAQAFRQRADDMTRGGSPLASR